jgi:hypothetical protein
MHPHLRKVLAVALHPGTCDGEASAAFSAARRLVARNGLPDAEVQILSRDESSPTRTRADSASPGQRTVWRVSIPADRLHDFLGMLIAKTAATDVRLMLRSFALRGRHVHTPTRLEFALTGARPCVELVGGWIASYLATAGFRVRHRHDPEASGARGERAHCAR